MFLLHRISVFCLILGQVIPFSVTAASICVWQLKSEIVRGVKVRALGSRIG